MIDFDKLIHEKARLKILTGLATCENMSMSFNKLKSELGMTAGNLSVQLNRLCSAGMLEIQKEFKANRPLTTVRLTLKGKSALSDYLSKMESIISKVKSCCGEFK